VQTPLTTLAAPELQACARERGEEVPMDANEQAQRMTLIEVINWTVEHAAKYGDVELLVALEAAGIARKPEPAARATPKSSAFLCGVKALYNDKIYNVALWLVHSYGEEVARLYVQQFTPVRLGF
jgi:hypothetical protein